MTQSLVFPATNAALPVRAPVPAWAPRADRALALAHGAIRVIHSVTPIEWRTELDHVTARWIAGHDETPRLSYRPAPDLSLVRSGLEALVEALGGQSGLGALYAGRAAELALEAQICQSAGTPALRRLAACRYAAPATELERADALAERWVSEPAPRGSRPRTIRTDDDRDPDSLLSAMRRAVGELRLGVRVVVSRELASLAATGDGAVQVVADRELDAAAARRTVLHEIEGHVLPGVHARARAIGLFALGTARGSDDQEGRAVALERRANLLDWPRRRELGLRHVAARSLAAGADFHATVRLLLDRDAPVADAVRIAARVHRGGGLGREVVYLPALLRYEAAPQTEAVLRLGRVSVAAAPLLAPYC